MVEEDPEVIQSERYVIPSIAQVREWQESERRRYAPRVDGDQETIDFMESLYNAGATEEEVREIWGQIVGYPPTGRLVAEAMALIENNRFKRAQEEAMDDFIEIGQFGELITVDPNRKWALERIASFVDAQEMATEGWEPFAVHGPHVYLRKVIVEDE